MAGVMDIDSADKISRMVRFATLSTPNRPSSFPGFCRAGPGTPRVIRHGAKVLFAYSEASVPKVSVITAGLRRLCVSEREHLGTDIIRPPSAEIAVMARKAQ